MQATQHHSSGYSKEKPMSSSGFFSVDNGYGGANNLKTITGPFRDLEILL